MQCECRDSVWCVGVLSTDSRMIGRHGYIGYIAVSTNFDSCSPCADRWRLMLLTHLSFLHSWVDYCNVIVVTLKLLSLLHAAARLVTSVRWNKHANSTWYSPLVTCMAVDHVQDSNDGVQMRSWRVYSGILHWRMQCIPVETVARRAKICSPRHGDHIISPIKTKTVSTVLHLLFGLVFHITFVKVEDNSLVI